MSKLFMYGTSLEGIEQLMVTVPNFQDPIIWEGVDKN